MSRQYAKGPVLTLNRDDCIYLAGLLDGEGCFSVSVAASKGKPKYNARIRIAMSHKPTIDWVAAVLGRSVRRHGLSRKAIPNAKHMYRVGIENVEAIASLIDQVLPFLKTKREVAVVLLEFCRARILLLNSSIEAKRYTAKDIMNFQRIRELNQVGLKAFVGVVN